MGGPTVIVVDDGDALARTGATFVADVLEERPTATVVVATGETPMGLYGELAQRVREGRCDAHAMTVVQLDEYLGLAPGDRRSLFGWMGRSFLQPLGIADAQVRRLPVTGDVDDECRAFDEALAEQGGVDLAILGLGPNGHLGFNEPPTPRSSPTRRVRLTAISIEANARYWGSVADVPGEAVTLGLGPLLAARAILLVVAGPTKRTIVHRALEGPVGPDVPASYLQGVPAATVIVDRDAWGEG